MQTRDVLSLAHSLSREFEVLSVRMLVGLYIVVRMRVVMGTVIPLMRVLMHMGVVFM